VMCSHTQFYIFSSQTVYFGYVSYASSTALLCSSVVVCMSYFVIDSAAAGESNDESPSEEVRVYR